jgi:hypothetical protein
MLLGVCGPRSVVERSVAGRGRRPAFVRAPALQPEPLREHAPRRLGQLLAAGSALDPAKPGALALDLPGASDAPDRLLA